MKKIVYLSLLLLVTHVLANAQPKDEKEVAEAVEKLNKAMIDADKNTLEKLTAVELSYGHSSGKVENKDQFVDGVVNGAIKFSSIDISDQHISFAGDIAIVRHIFSAKIINSGTPSDIKLGVLLIWKKQKGEWKLLARQAVKL